MKRKPDPDFERLHKAITRSGIPDRAPLFEFLVDAEIMEAVTEVQTLNFGLTSSQAELDTVIERLISFYWTTGYDYAPVYLMYSYPDLDKLSGDDTAELSHGKRFWWNEGKGPINSWQDFEKYPWPALDSLGTPWLETAGRHLKEGMKVFVLCGGVQENAITLMGYEGLSIALIEQPDLVEAVFEELGKRLVHGCEIAAREECVGAVCNGDDMGYKTSTTLSPDHTRQYSLRWHKKACEAVHAEGKPFVLHSCGQLEGIMDDVIDMVGVDAKHSFEDTILPVSQAKAKYGDRIGIVGGIDVDFLCRSSEEDVRAKTRETLEACMPGGGYAVGSGNSVANYIPVRNYLAMVDEALQCGHY